MKKGYLYLLLAVCLALATLAVRAFNAMASTQDLTYGMYGGGLIIAALILYTVIYRIMQRTLG